MSKEQRKLLTIDDVGEQLAIKKSKVRNLIFKKQLRYLKITQLIRFQQEYIDDYLKKLEVKGGKSND